MQSLSLHTCRALSEEHAPENPWRVAQGALFGGLDRFTSGVTQLQAVFNAAAQFLRLDRVEIGSTKAGLCPRSLMHGANVAAQ